MVKTVTAKTSSVVKARREEIELGDRRIEVFQLPNGEYRLSQTQVAEAVEKEEVYVRNFLGSKSPEALPYKGFTPETIAVEGEKTRIKAVPVLLAVAFWTKEAVGKNSVAARLLGACAAESIEKRADKVFGIQRRDEEYNERFKRNFEELKLIILELESLDSESENSQVIDDETFSVIEASLKTELKFPIHGWEENRIRDELANLAARTDRWRLKIEDKLESIFGSETQYRYPDLTSGVFSGTIATDGIEYDVVFIFECKNPIVNLSDIKECIYDREYLDSARRKYKTEHVFLFMVAPFGGSPMCYPYIKRKLAPEDSGYVRVLTVKQMANFLRNQVAVSNRYKKSEITKRFREILDYPISFAVEGFGAKLAAKASKSPKKKAV